MIFVEGDENQDMSKCSAELKSISLMFFARAQELLHWSPHAASSDVSSELSNENRSTEQYGNCRIVECVEQTHH